MALPAVAGNTILAADLYQLCQPSGGTETGKYYIDGESYTNGAHLSQYMSSTSRVSVPVSVSIDTVDRSATNTAAPATSHLTANGFLVLCTCNTSAQSAGAGGNYTIQY